MIKVGEAVSDALFIPSGRSLRYVRLQGGGGGAPPGGSARTRLWSAAHIWREKSNFKFCIYLLVPKFYCFYTINLMYLNIKLYSVTLLSKFSNI